MVPHRRSHPDLQFLSLTGEKNDFVAIKSVKKSGITFLLAYENQNVICDFLILWDAAKASVERILSNALRDIQGRWGYVL